MIIETQYQPLSQQQAFRSSKVRVRGYGGAMGGGKSRAICEEIFDLSLEYPGLKTLLARQRHTSIVETTKKTMMNEVIPRQIIAKSKESAGEDWILLKNDSVIHFVGLEDPIRWFSSEIGFLAIDEAQEVDEDTVLKLSTRLRQRDMPNKMVFSFNPDNPGHWLQRWFIIGSDRTEYGFRKDKLFPTDSENPIGDCEFFFARATDNHHLPAGYVENTLSALPPALRRRFVEGIWEFVSGTCYFDLGALNDYRQNRLEKPKWVGRTTGSVDDTEKDKIRIEPGKSGPLWVWQAPIRAKEENAAHRYILGVDTASGGSSDYSSIQVVDVDDFSQVAEFKSKLDPDLLAVEAFRLARVYNNALIAPEVNGGWGASTVRELERMHYGKLYTRRVEDRISKVWTDQLGWDTTVKRRAHMYDTLERVLREREFGLRSERTLHELFSFVRDENGRPAAQQGCNDDLVSALAIAVTIASQRPRDQKRSREREYAPQFTATGY